MQALREGLDTSAPGPALEPAFARAAPYLAALLPDFGDRFPDHPAPAMPHDSEHARFYFFDAVTRLLRTMAAEQALLLVFDDLQWADAPSLLLLQFVARQLRTARLMVVGTYRETDVHRAPAVAAALGTLVREGHHLPLRGLSEVEVARFLEDATGDVASDELVGLVHRQTDGNPFFLDEIARLIAAGALGEPRKLASGVLPVPQGVREAIHRRLSPLSDRCLRLLRMGSVVGHRFELASLAAAAEATPESLLADLSEAIAGGIVAADGGSGRYRFSHALVRETVYEELDARSRALWHARIGIGLERLYAGSSESHLAELAHHFLAAASPDDVRKGVAFAIRAGRHATATFAYEEAVALYHRVLEVQSPLNAAEDREHCDLLIALGEAEWRVTGAAAARGAFLEAAEIARRLGDAARLGRCALGFAGEGSQIFWVESGVVDPVIVGLLEEALAAIGDRDPSLRSQLLARLAMDLYFSSSRERCDALSAEAVALARREAKPRVLVAALRARCVALWRPEHAEERFAVASEIVEVARGIGDLERALAGHKFRIVGFLERGDVDGVDRELDQWACIAAELRQPQILAELAMRRAMRLTLEGRFAAAESEALRALKLGQRAREPSAHQRHVAQIGVLRVLQGRCEELLQDALAFIDRYPAVPAGRSWLAFLHARIGRHEEARCDLDRLAPSDFAALPRDANWLLAMSHLATVASTLGDTARAERLYQQLLPYSDRVNVVGGTTCWGSVSQFLGELAATLERRDQAVQHFEVALEAHRRMGARALAAESEAALAGALRRRGGAGDVSRADDLTRSAAGTARSLGMAGLEARLADAGGEAAGDGAALRRDGEFWIVHFAGRSVRLRDSKGLGDLALLLGNPGREFHVADLIAAAEPELRAARLGEMSAAALASEGLRLGRQSLQEPAIDDRARSAYRTRLVELHGELDDAEACNDPGRAARARAELDFLAGELAAAFGRAGRPRVAAGSPAERARKAVTWRIRDAIARTHQEHSDLGEHLERHVRTGVFCRYNVPDEPVEWRIER